jgi:signal transduction histidine kinase
LRQPYHDGDSGEKIDRTLLEPASSILQISIRPSLHSIFIQASVRTSLDATTSLTTDLLDTPSVVASVAAEAVNPWMLLQALPDGLLLCHAVRNELAGVSMTAIEDFRIVFANPAAAELATKRGAITETHLLAVFPQMRHDGLFDRLAEVVVTGRTFATERFFADTRTWLRVAGTPFADNPDALLITLSETASQDAGTNVVQQSSVMASGVISSVEPPSNHENNHDSHDNHEDTTNHTPRIGGTSAVVRQLRKRFDAIFNNMFQFTYLVSTDGIVLEANQTAINFAHDGGASVLGKPLASLSCWALDDDRKRVETSVYRASGGEFMRFTAEFMHLEGSVTVDFSLKPIFNQFGDIDFVVAEGRDISAVKKIESERDKERELADSLHKLNQLKNEFLSSVSHELRTPLASIIGFAQTLLRDRTMPEITAQKFLNIILDDGRRLSRLVEDLLDLSRIESGRLSLVAVSANIVDVVDYAVHLAGAEASAKSLTLEVVRPPEAIMTEFDRDRMTQVFVNLMDNAVKFTPDGGTVRVLFAIKSLTDALQTVHVSVSDTGVGIAPDDLPFLFEKFYRVKQSGKEIRGTGLGLAIAKQIAEMHNGKITIDSTVGEGSTFTVVLPVVTT